MAEYFYEVAGHERLARLAQISGGLLKKFGEFNQAVFADGALSAKHKELIAVACTHITRCPYCINTHAQKAEAAGATPEEIGEAIMVAAAINAGASIAHAGIATKALSK